MQKQHLELLPRERHRLPLGLQQILWHYPVKKNMLSRLVLSFDEPPKSRVHKHALLTYNMTVPLAPPWLCPTFPCPEQLLKRVHPSWSTAQQERGQDLYFLQ